MVDTTEMLAMTMAAVITYMMWSLLYKDNPFYRFIQYSFIGALTGWVFTVALRSVYSTWITAVPKGDIISIVGVFFGATVFIRYFVKKWSFYSRLPALIIVGSGYGISLISTIKAQILDQIVATFKPLTSIDNIIMWVTVIAVTFYFYFSTEHKGPLKYVSTWARYLMMIAFGASFGFGFMARVPRVMTPLRDYMLTSPQIYLVPIVLLIVLADYMRTKGKIKS